MTTAPAGPRPHPDPGVRLFARYAHAPNSRGYCGPDVGDVFARVACGSTDPAGLARAREAACRFSGAWPYQLLIAELTQQPDPLSEAVGRAYWTGSALTAAVDRERFGRALVDRFAARAGRYWAHLDETLLPEVAPTHAFHVLGVYPWSRLLGAGRPEPLMVLDSCRIRAGRVLDVDGPRLRVETDRLAADGPGLRLAEPGVETIDWVGADGAFVEADEFSGGDTVAIHWGFACDRLSAAEADWLRESTARQVDLTDARLRGDPGE